MGRMMAFRPARKEHRKSPFLKAFVRIGTISGAARAVRISRDAVHDWIRNDESFARQLEHAKRKHLDEPFRSLESSLVLVSDVVRPLVAPELWPRIAAALAIAVAHLKHDLTGSIARPGKVAKGSLAHDAFEEVAVPNRARETFANDL